MKRFNFLHPSFILFFLWFLISGKIFSFLTFFIVLFIHELGHYLVARKLGYKVNRFYLTPCGASLGYNNVTLSKRDEIKIALAGPFFNLFFSVFVTAIWWVFPIVYVVTIDFVIQSICLALLNLLPAYPLDGGRVFTTLLSEKIGKVKSLKISKINNICFVVLFILLFIISCFYNYNPTLILFAVFLLSGLLQIKEDIKYELMSFYKKNTQNFSKMRMLYINGEVKLVELLKKIEKNRYTIFYLKNGFNKGKFITEDLIITLTLSYPLSMQINKIILEKKLIKNIDKK